MMPTSICAWCSGFDRRDPANKGQSHGMCPTCAAKFQRELDAREAKPALKPAGVHA